MANGIPSSGKEGGASIKNAIGKSIKSQKSGRSEKLFENSSNQKRIEDLRSRLGYTRSDISAAKAKQKSLGKASDIAEIDANRFTNDGQYRKDLARKEKDQGVKEITMGIRYFALANELSGSDNSGDRIQGMYLQNKGEELNSSGNQNMNQSQQNLAKGAGLVTQGTMRAIQGVMLEHAKDGESDSIMKGMAALQVLNGQLGEASMAILMDNLGDKIDKDKELQGFAVGLGLAVMQDSMGNRGSTEMRNGDFNMLSGGSNATKFAMKSGIRLGVKEGLDSIGAGDFVDKGMADQMANNIITMMEGGPGAQIAQLKSFIGVMTMSTGPNNTNPVGDFFSEIEQNGVMDIAMGVSMNHDPSFRDGLSKLANEYLPEDQKNLAPLIVNADHIINTARTIAASGTSPINPASIGATVNGAVSNLNPANSPLMNRDGAGSGISNTKANPFEIDSVGQEAADRQNPLAGFTGSLTSSFDSQNKTNQLS